MQEDKRERRHKNELQELQCYRNTINQDKMWKHEEQISTWVSVIGISLLRLKCPG